MSQIYLYWYPVTNYSNVDELTLFELNEGLNSFPDYVLKAQGRVY